MKRLIAFLGIALLLMGIRFYDDGIYRFTGGHLTVYGKHSEYSPKNFCVTGEPYRIDYIDKAALNKMLDKSKAQIVKTELNGRLIYAYSPLINKTEWLGCKRFNMMIYTAKSGKISVGVPILMGSY